MKRIVGFVVATLLMGGVISCSEEVSPKPLTYTQVFTGTTSKTWDLRRLMARERNKDQVTYSLGSCRSDDRYTFYANAERLYEVTNGRSSCDSEEGDLLVSYTWEYNSASATMNMVLPHIFGDFIIPLTVVEVDDENMVLELPLSEDNATAYIFEFTAVEN